MNNFYGRNTYYILLDFDKYISAATWINGRDLLEGDGTEERAKEFILLRVPVLYFLFIFFLIIDLLLLFIK